MNREWMVLSERIELSTSHLPSECSTTELRQHSCATVFALTNGVCVPKSNAFASIKHLKFLNESREINLRTRKGVTSHAFDTLNWTNGKLYHNNRESLVSLGVLGESYD